MGAGVVHLRVAGDKVNVASPLISNITLRMMASLPT